MDGIAEIAVQGVHIAAIPSDLDGVADGAFYPAGGGRVALGDLRVQALGHGVDIAVVGGGQQNRIAQKLVALDVRRNADLMQNFGHGQLIGIQGHRLRARRVAGGFQHAVYQHALIKGLYKKERKTVIQQFLLDLLALEGAGHKKGGAHIAGVLRLVALLYGDGIQIGHKGIQQNGVGMYIQQGFQRLAAVFLAHGHGNALFLQRLAAKRRNLSAGIRHNKLDLFHRKTPPYISRGGHRAGGCGRCASVDFVYNGNITIKWKFVQGEIFSFFYNYASFVRQNATRNLNTIKILAI